MDFNRVSSPMNKISVVKLVLQETGTYNPMAFRPYETYIDGESMQNIMRRVDESNGTTVTGTLLSGVTSEVLRPAANHKGIIPIPCGWAERRIRFVMEVNVTSSTGTVMIYFFQGYTSHLGVGHSGAIDPNMEFIINSYTRVTRAFQNTQFGTTVRDVITESAQVINGNIVHQVDSGNVYGMRPQDIFTGIQSAYLDTAYAMGNRKDTLMDTRVQMSGESIKSNRGNSVSSNFVAKLIDTYQTGSKLLDFGQGEQDVFSRCQGIVHESSPYENPFIRAISNVRNVHCSTTFTMGNLECIDNSVRARTHYITLGTTQMSTLAQAGTTEYWTGSDRTTTAANVLSNAVPAIMMELMICGLIFRSTNHDSTGVPVTTIAKPVALTNIDISSNLELFKRRLEREIMFDLTFGNQDLYMLEMSVDMYGDTTISLSLGSGPMITYTTPSFCDSLMAPVISTSKDQFFGVVHDFETLFNNLPCNTNTTPAINNLI